MKPNDTIAVEESLRRQERGWLVPYLIDLDVAEIQAPANLALPGKPKGVPFTYKGHGRWDYWLRACMAGELPTAPIPQIIFTAEADRNDAKAVEDCLEYHIRRHGGWYDEAWLKMVRWLLWGFGVREMEDEIARIPADTRAHWYANFNLANLLHSQTDWSAMILQGNLPGDTSRASKFAKGTGFFSTPLEVCQMMTEMTFGIENAGRDTRILSVCDPCCGTGSMLLPASNYSLCLFGQDIVWDLVLCARLNGFLFAPWLVHMPDYMQNAIERERERQERISATPLQPDVTTGVTLTEDPRAIAEITARRAAFREACEAGALEQVSLFSEFGF